MTVFDLFWLVFLLSAFQPIFQQWVLESARRRMISLIEKKRGSRVILLVHREETMRFLGFPVMRYIDVNDSEEVIRAIQMTDPDVPIDIVLHTPGGLVLSSLQIAYALRKHPAKVTAFVPHYAMSGGTLIALACDEIVMSEYAVLGPVDPQLGKYPAASVLRLREEKKVDEIEDESLIMADMAEKAIRQMRKAVKSILSDRYSEDRAEELARILSEGRWTHDYPITYEEAKALGLNVSNELPTEIYELMMLYPQPVRYQPAVEYIPVPKQKGGKV